MCVFHTGSARLRSERVSEAYGGTEAMAVSSGTGINVHDILTSLKVLLSNPTFMFLNMAGASEGLCSPGVHQAVGCSTQGGHRWGGGTPAGLTEILNRITHLS